MIAPPDIVAKVRLFLSLVQEAADEQLAEIAQLGRDGKGFTREQWREYARRRADYWVPTPSQALSLYKMREAERARARKNSGPK